MKYLMAAAQGILLAMVAAIYAADSMPLVLVYGAAMGAQMGVQAIVREVVWPNYFGRRHLSTIRGVNMMAGVIGSALGPLPFGYAYDVFGGGALPGAAGIHSVSPRGGAHRAANRQARRV